MRRYPVYPILISVSPVLAFYIRNVVGRSLHELWPPLLLAAGISTIAYVFLGLLLRNFHRAAIIVSIAAVSLFVLGSSPLSSLGAALRYRELRPFYAAAVWVPVALAGLYVTVRTRRELSMYTAWLNATGCILAGILLVNLCFTIARSRADQNGLYALADPDNPTIALKQRQAAPDIFYITLDAYGRTDVLKDYYDHDNSRLIKFLERRGFYVARDSHSNYSNTLASLASSLNVSLLNRMARTRYNCNGNVLIPMIGDNRVMRSLRKAGYKTAVFDPEWSALRIRDSDYRISGPTDREFGAAWEKIVSLRQLGTGRNDGITRYDFRREWVKYVFRHIADAPTPKQPVFVLAHISCPHEPFVFGSSGEAVRPKETSDLWDEWSPSSDESRKLYVRGYRNQAAFVTDAAERMIERILKRPRPAVIILQSDHGPASMLHSRNLMTSNFRERLGILNAYYFPDRQYGSLYQSISPVNSFRVVFNKYFGASLDLLPDQAAMSTFNRPLKLHTVRERLSVPGETVESPEPRPLILRVPGEASPAAHL